MSVNLAAVTILVALSFLCGVLFGSNVPRGFHELSAFGAYVERSVSGTNCPNGYTCLENSSKPVDN